MNDNDDTGRRRRPPEPEGSDEPELVDDDEVLLVGGDEQLDTEAEESTGRFQVPESVLQGGGYGNDEPPLLDEDDFAEDTAELDAGEFFDQAADAAGTNPLAVAAESEAGPDTLDDEGSTTGASDETSALRDTLDEPLAPSRRRRSRQRLSPTEPGRPVFTADPAAEWSEDTRAADYQDEPATDGFEDSGSQPGGEDFAAATPELSGAAAEPWNQPEVAAGEATAILQPEGEAGQEKTLIFGQEDQQQQVYPVLLVVQGEEEGREIELVPDHVTVGRGADNDLVFPDIACSRRHAVIQRQGDRLSITDLGSGNGTLVNGKRIQQADLRDGDEVQIGTTVLQVVWPVSAAGVEHRPGSTITGGKGPIEGRGGSTWLGALLSDPRRRKLLLFGGGGVMGLLLVLLVVKLASGSGRQPQPKPDELRLRQQQQQAEFKAHFQKVKTYIDEMKWQEAALEVQLALKLRPANSLLLEYKDFIEKQLRAQAALQEASEFLARDDLENAILAARRVDKDSKYAKQARQLIEECRHKSVQKIIDSGKQLLEQKQLAQALLKFEEALEQEPQNEEAILLREQTQATLDAERKRLAARRVRSRRKRRPRRKRPAHGVTGQILAFYKNGELDRAINKAEEMGSHNALVRLKKFKAVFERAQQLGHNQGQVRRAIEFWEKADQLDRALAGGQGQYHELIRKRLAKSYFLVGVDAMMSKRYPQAYRAFVKARKLGVEKASVHLKKLEAEAKRLYETAYILQHNKPEQARHNLEIVVGILPPDHVYYNKAKKLLAKLNVGGSYSNEPEGGF